MPAARGQNGQMPLSCGVNAPKSHDTNAIEPLHPDCWLQRSYGDYGW